MYLVSACLAGIACKYDGAHNLCPQVQKLVASGNAIPVCPEQLGGLPTPRLPAEIKGGNGLDVWQGNARVMTVTGKDVTAAFQRGAAETMKLARSMKIQEAILKARSPSCGSATIYDGSFTGIRHPGQGVTAALLSSAGLKLWSEENWNKSSNKRRC